jgi:flavin reductase (DIM6/NTAB) family NADH-FMN oxidoreductase RutF
MSGMGDFHFYEPKDGHGLPHDPIKAIVAPRPIGWISTINAAGRVNLAPYSYFNAVADRPAILAFSSFSKKDSETNAEATGEFVFNLATRPLAEAMNRTSYAFTHGVSEMEEAGLTPAASRIVRPPRVAASPAAIECRVTDIVAVKDLNGRPTNNTLILGQVVGVHIDSACLVDGLFDITRARTIARCGYAADYLEVTELFQMHRPR